VDKLASILQIVLSRMAPLKVERRYLFFAKLTATAQDG
jgi:hypothetical protein